MNKKNILYLLIFMGLVCMIASKTLCKKVPKTVTTEIEKPVIKPAEVKKELAESEKAWQQMVWQMQAESSALQKKFQQANRNWRNARDKSGLLETQLNKWIKESHSRQSSSPEFLTDSTLPKIDTSMYSPPITETIENYMQQANQLDSFATEAVSLLHSELNIRDSIITKQEEKYNRIKNSLNVSLGQQSLLLKQEWQYKKQLKKERFKSKFLSVCVLTLSAITTKLLLLR
jgi:hypothetical protein